MNLSENFPLAEFTKSQQAIRLGIKNEPTPEHLENLTKLVRHVLQPARYALGPINVNSGYRSPELNKAVGGATKSQHSKGEAADIECPRVGNRGLARWIANNCEFDQLILEGYNDKDPTSGWVHVSYREGANRNEMLICRFVNGIAHYERANLKF